MTITQETDQPDISFHPTAPPLPTTTTAPIDVYASVATVTAIPIVSATSVPDSSTILEVSPTLTSSCPDGTDIERTMNSDGSLSVKITIIATQGDGYHDIRIEHYMIPAPVANSVMQSLDITGMAPSSVYMTKIEDHHLPPEVNVAEALSSLSPPAHATLGIPQGGVGGTAAITSMGMTDYERNRRKRVTCFFIAMTAVVIWIILKSVL
ncbi:hypothetical protein ACHAWX_007721 [Stephanocyclus meneghinianus]